MGQQDWYRRTTWTRRDQDEFAARLARSRSAFNKAQYLRIQALSLQQAGGRGRLLAALSLLDELVGLYPDELSLGTALMQRAECLEQLGRTDEAIDAYRGSLDAQRANPTVRDGAYLGYAALVVTRLRRLDLYVEVLAVLEEFGGGEVFPVQQYRYNALRAFILSELGRYLEAREAAILALAASAKKESPFRYHRGLGIVTNPEVVLQKRLERIAR